MQAAILPAGGKRLAIRRRRQRPDLLVMPDESVEQLAVGQAPQTDALVLTGGQDLLIARHDRNGDDAQLVPREAKDLPLFLDVDQQIAGTLTCFPVVAALLPAQR